LEVVPVAKTRRRPIGLAAIAVFFAFGASMCLLTILALSFPDTPLQEIWRLKPEARSGFEALGDWGIPLMAVVGASCAAAAAGLWHYREWGRRLAVAILLVNLLGDTLDALAGHNLASLIGLPVGGLMIAYLLSPRVRADFRPGAWNPD
jgi:hypothetical protein